MQQAGSTARHWAGRGIPIVLALAVAMLAWRVTSDARILTTRQDEQSRLASINEQLEAAHSTTLRQLEKTTGERDGARHAQAAAERRQVAEASLLRQAIVQKGRRLAASQRHVAACAAFAAALSQQENDEARTGYMRSLARTPSLRWASPRPLPVRAAALSPDGSRLVLRLEQQDGPDIVSVMDLPGGGQETARISLSRIFHSAAGLRGLAASARARLVAVANDLGDVVVIETTSGLERARFRWPEAVHVVCLSADGQRLAVATPRGEVAVVRMDDQARHRRWAGADSEVADLAFDAATTSLWIGLANGSTWSWDLTASGSEPSPDSALSTIRTTNPPGLVTPEGVAAERPGPTLVLPPQTPGQDLAGESLAEVGTATPLAGVLVPNEQRVVVAALEDARLIVMVRQGEAGSRHTTTWEAGGSARPLASVSLSHHGRVAASGDLAGGVSIWITDAPGSPPHRVTVHREGASIVAVSPDADLVASAGEDGAIRILDAASGAERHAFGQEGVPATRLAWSESSRLLAVGDAAGRVRVWSRDSEQEVAAQQLFRNAITALTLTADEPRVVAADPQGNIRILDVASGEPRPGSDGATTPGLLATLSRDGRWLASASGDLVHQEIVVRDLRSGQSRHLEVSGAPLTSLALSPKGDLLVAGNGEGLVTSWDLPETTPRITMASHRGAVNSLVLSGDHGRLLVSGGEDGSVVMHDLHSLEVRRRPTAPTRDPRAAAASPAGQQVALASAHEPARLVDLAANTDQALTARGHRRSIASLAFSPDGRLLASGARDGAVILCAASTGDREARLEGHKGWTTALAFAASGELLAAGSDDGTVRVTEVASRRRTITLTAHGVFIEALAFSPDGQRLVSGGQDPRVLVRELRGGRTLLTLSDHSGFIHAAAWNPQDAVIASGGGDGVVRLHHADTGAPLAAHRIGATVRSLAFHPTGDWLAVGSDSPQVTILAVPTLEPVAEIHHVGEKARLVALTGGSSTHAGRLVVVTNSADAQNIINEIDLDTLHLGISGEGLMDQILQRTGTRLLGLDPNRLGIELLRYSRD